MTQEDKHIIIEKVLEDNLRDILNPCDEIIKLVSEKPDIFIEKMKDMPYKDRIETLVWILASMIDRDDGYEDRLSNLKNSDIKKALLSFRQDLVDIQNVNKPQKTKKIAKI